MRSKADETLVIVETLICPLQISRLRSSFRLEADFVFLSLFIYDDLFMMMIHFYDDEETIIIII